MLITEETNQAAHSTAQEVERQSFSEAELVGWMESSNGKEKLIAQNALMEIQQLQQQLATEQNRLQEVTRFLGNWTDGFDSIIKTPVNMQDDELVRIRFGALRDSAKNLVDSCRQKMKELAQKK